MNILIIIIEACWDSGMYQQLSEKTYLLKMSPLLLPGIDNITPEIEVDIVYNNEEIRMSSGNWTLRGNQGAIVKDSRFMQTFDIKLTGAIKIVNVNSDNSITSSSSSSSRNTPDIRANGWVEYQVQGEKPSIFKATPPFVLNTTIMLIKDTVSEFATAQFSSRFLKAFRKFMLADLRKQSQLKSENSGSL